MGTEPCLALHKHLSSICFSTVKELLYVLWCGRVQRLMVTLVGPEKEITVLVGLLLAEVRRLLATHFQAKFSHGLLLLPVCRAAVFWAEQLLLVFQRVREVGPHILMRWGMWPELQGSMKQINKMSRLVEAGSFTGVGIGGSERWNGMPLVKRNAYGCMQKLRVDLSVLVPDVVPSVPFYRVQQVMNGGVESMVNSIDFSEMVFPCSCWERSNSFVRSSRQSQQMHFLLQHCFSCVTCVS